MRKIFAGVGLSLSILFHPLSPSLCGVSHGREGSDGV